MKQKFSQKQSVKSIDIIKKELKLKKMKIKNATKANDDVVLKKSNVATNDRVKGNVNKSGFKNKGKREKRVKSKDVDMAEKDKLRHQKEVLILH